MFAPFQLYLCARLVQTYGAGVDFHGGYRLKLLIAYLFEHLLCNSSTLQHEAHNLDAVFIFKAVDVVGHQLIYMILVNILLLDWQVRV